MCCILRMYVCSYEYKTDLFASRTTKIVHFSNRRVWRTKPNEKHYKIEKKKKPIRKKTTVCESKRKRQ